MFRNANGPSDPTEIIEIAGTIYFIAKDDTGLPLLWKIEDSVSDITPVKVRTGQGNQVANPSNLGTAVNLTGATAIDRVYFSCDGTGTEHAGRGRELWVFQD